MEEEMRIVCGIGSSEGELCEAIIKLHRCIKHKNVTPADLIENGIVEACVGYIRSTRFSHYFRAHVCAVLNLLSQGNREVKQQICNPANFTQMLDDITSVCFSSVKDRVLLVEQATSLIQTLTYDHNENQNTLKKLGLVELLINLCDVYGVKHAPNLQCRFPDETLRVFRQLTSNKVMIGKVRQLEDKKLMYLQTRLSTAYKGLESEEVYEIDLFDTTTDRDVCISQELISAGLAWPSLDQVSQKECMEGQDDGVWSDVIIPEITDMQCFGVHLLEDGTVDTIHRLEDILKYKDPLERLQTKPSIGEIIIADRIIHSQRRLYRAKVKDWCTASTILVKALDYGYMERLPWQQQYAIPESLRSIPPQAVLCTLRGVHSPPLSTVIVENSLAILQNLCQHSLTNRQFIVNSSNFDVIMKLCQSPVASICQSAAGVLLNCARNANLRSFIGRRGGITAMLDLCKRYPTNEGVLLTAIGALQNQLYECMVSCQKMADLNGWEDLVNILRGNQSEAVRMKALCAINNLCASVIRLEDVFDLSISLQHETQLDMVSVIDKDDGVLHLWQHDQKQSSLEENDVDTVKARTNQIRKSTESFSGQFIVPVYSPSSSAVHKAIHPTAMENVVSVSPENHGVSHVPVPGARDATCPLSADDGRSRNNTALENRYLERNEEDFASKESVLINAAQMIPEDDTLPFYIEGISTKIKNDDTHDISPFAEVPRILSLRASRTICAFLNSGRGGTIYFGIGEEGHVHGVKVTRNERDRIRLNVDRIMTKMIPAVTHNKFSVVFAPVVKEEGHQSSAERQQLEDVFVIELHINPTTGTIYTTPDPTSRCYYRHGNENFQYTHQEIREMILLEEEKYYQAEIRSLKNEIKKVSGSLHGEMI